MVVDVLVTMEDVILLSGLSCYYAAVAVTMVLAAATIMAAVMIVFGLSSFYSAAVDGEMVTVAASKPGLKKRSIA